MTALDDLSSVVAALPVVESAEGPGDLASHGERATTLPIQVSEKDTTQATQASEKVTTQVSEKVTLAIPVSEKAMDTEWHRKSPTFLSQFSRNPAVSKESVSIFEFVLFPPFFKVSVRRTFRNEQFDCFCNNKINGI